MEVFSFLSFSEYLRCFYRRYFDPILSYEPRS
nr:MAG TPA: hypothetical protein [Caudoviricetes sp.]